MAALLMAMIGGLANPETGFAAPTALRVLTYEGGPYVRRAEDGRITGDVYEVLRPLFSPWNASTGEPMVEMLPFARALRVASQESGLVVFPLARTADREHLFKWAGPLASSAVFFFAYKPAHRLADESSLPRKHVTIGVGRDDTLMRYLIDRQLTNLQPLASETQAVKMLALGRVDVVLMNEAVLKWVAQELGLPLESFQKIGPKVFNSHLYAAFSKDIDDSVVKAWQSRIDRVSRVALR